MKKCGFHRFTLLVLAIFMAVAMVSCSQNKIQKSPGKAMPNFAEAHDAFQTKLLEQNKDSDEIPAPPEGMFDLVKYTSKVGDLAAYVSSDPKDSKKHPMIIWIVGGWGNGIDEFPWSYATWDNDQTGSAFWKADILTMYPSFRGGNGNPGYYETLFGEVDDIASAYEYAASLPYVDPERIYLGGHSTGGTRALLAAEYMDKFRGVFCFGAVDEIKYHNNSQFTFDITNKEEYIMRSPIYWLQDIKTPTFLIEGVDGNSINLKNIRDKSSNKNIHCYLVDGADHFSALAPITELLAQKIISDTGKTSNITLTDEEVKTAMAQPPKISLPVMFPVQYKTDLAELNFSCPYQWDIQKETFENGEMSLSMYSKSEEDHPWDMTSVFIDTYISSEQNYAKNFRGRYEAIGYTITEIDIGGIPCLEASGIELQDDGSKFNNKVVLLQKDNCFAEANFYIPESFGDAGDPLYKAIADTIRLV